jgi:hypothetical protein
MVSPAEVRRLLGDLEDETIAEILKLQPTLPDLEAAAICLDGTLDPLTRSGHSLSKATAGILEIMLPDTEEDESDRNR